jgi:hypothetical protein
MKICLILGARRSPANPPILSFIVALKIFLSRMQIANVHLRCKQHFLVRERTENPNGKNPKDVHGLGFIQTQLPKL